MTTTTTGRRKGGKMIHLHDDALARVQAYQERFQAENPGFEVTLGGVLANLVHQGLDAVERGPFQRMARVYPHHPDAPIPYVPAEGCVETVEEEVEP